VSEPTYRVELTHDPASGNAVCWEAKVYAVAEYDEAASNFSVFTGYGGTREDAFTVAQDWCKAKATEPLAPSTVFLTEDGELLDPFEVQT
jgi:hypothetical protein